MKTPTSNNPNNNTKMKMKFTTNKIWMMKDKWYASKSNKCNSKWKTNKMQRLLNSHRQTWMRRTPRRALKRWTRWCFSSFWKTNMIRILTSSPKSPRSNYPRLLIRTTLTGTTFACFSNRSSRRKPVKTKTMITMLTRCKSRVVSSRSNKTKITIMLMMMTISNNSSSNNRWWNSRNFTTNKWHNSKFLTTK